MRAASAWALIGATILPVAYAEAGQAKLNADDWPHYTRDLAGTRYSPLRQINTRNVSKLAPAWSFRLRPEELPHPTTCAASSTVGMLMTHSFVAFSMPNVWLRLLITQPTIQRERPLHASGPIAARIFSANAPASASSRAAGHPIVSPLSLPGLGMI